MAVLDSNCRNAAIPTEINILFKQGRKSVIRLDPIEGAIDFWWNSSINLKIKDVALKSGGCIESLENWSVRKLDLVSFLPTVDIGVFNQISNLVDVSHLVNSSTNYPSILDGSEI
jgi:hypothetical protein